MMLNDNQKIWEHDRTKSVGSSEIGMCARRVFCEKKNIPYDDGYVQTRGAMERGNIIEQKVFVPAMRRRFGRRVKFAGRSQQTLQLGMLSSTPDALVYPLKPDELGFDHGDCVMYECKSRDPRAKEGQLAENYRAQVIVQMGLVRQLTPYQPTHAVICIINASFIDEVEEHVVAYSADEFHAAQVRAGEIMGAMIMQEIKPEGYIAGGKECEYCPWAIQCGQQRREVPEKNDEQLDPQLLAELDHLASMIRTRQIERDVAEAAVREATETMKQRLREKNRRHFVGQRYKANWTSVKGRTSLNTADLEADLQRFGVSLLDYQIEGTPGDRLTITAI